MSAHSAASAIDAHAASSALIPSPSRTRRIGCCISVSLLRRRSVPTRVQQMTSLAAANERKRAPYLRERTVRQVFANVG